MKAPGGRVAGGAPVRAGLALTVWLICLLPAGAPPLRAAEGDGDVYVRDVKGIERAVEILAGEAESRAATEVVVAFDQMTFAPPPGRNEYASSHDYAGDVPNWLAALARWADDARYPIRVATTMHPKPFRVGGDGWQTRLRAEIEFAWWKSQSVFRPALHWVRRCLPEKGGMLVLISSELTPEQWVDPKALGVGNQRWRERLLPLGQYWNPEAIGTAVAHAGASLYVIAPEVQLGDETPAPVLPALPWASRPYRAFVPWSPAPSPTTLPEWTPPQPRKLTPEEEEAERAMLREKLRGRVPDEVLEQMIDELIRAGVTHYSWSSGRKRHTPTTPGDAPPDEDDDVPGGGGRFGSKTPLWFPHFRGTVLFNNHTPSAFGYWPYARAAKKSGGRYLFYPFPAARWLDVCPRDAHQLARMTPELGTRGKFAKIREGDRALSALCRACALVVDETPWRDVWTERRADGWAAYESVNPLRRTDDFQLRRKPFDLHLQGSGRQLRRAGKELIELVERYDRALVILDRALARIRDGAHASSLPRSIADLRLGRYWFSMSAFHLSALALYLGEIERFAPPGWDETKQDLVVSYVPAIRLSDCLDGYEGRALSAEAERSYPRLVYRADRRLGAGPWKHGTEIPAQQGNILRIPLESPDYRAKRPLSGVLRYLDRRLMARALDMIHSARAVMAHHAKTPWGWTTYYSEAYTFVFLPVPRVHGRDLLTGETDDDDDDDKPPWSPTPRGRGGSSPGGPTTGG